MRRKRNSESDPPVAEGAARVVGRVDYKVKNMEVDGDQIKLQVWDLGARGNRRRPFDWITIPYQLDTDHLSLLS